MMSTGTYTTIGPRPPMLWMKSLALVVVIVTQLRGAQSQLYPGETIEEACANAIEYEDPVCENNGTLHIGSRVEDDLSCSYCDCEEGWAGVECARCMDISVCPDKTINGTIVSASNCSSDSLIPTAEESAQELGKVFSCSCGGGEDGWTDTLCGLQPDTFVVFTVKGAGTDAEPADFTFTEYAGVDVTYQEAWEGEHDYYYPIIYEGAASDCRVTRGNCLEVDGTDLAEEECVRYDCQDTQGSCPPEGYPVCDGFPDCLNEDGEEYKVHTCTAVPESGVAITVACKDEQTVNGTYVCYYQQPGVFAPLSMTCHVGSCLYEGTDINEVETFDVAEAPLDTDEQSWLLIAGAVFLVLLFLLFALCTDWGSAKSDSSSCCLSKGKGGSANAFASSGTRSIPAPVAATTSSPFYTSNTDANGRDGIAPSSGAEGAMTAALASAGGLGAAPLGGAGVIDDDGLTGAQPALLHWKNLCYSVRVQGRWGAGLLGSLPGCRKPEMQVLRRVMGYAGPRRDDAGSASSAGRPLSERGSQPPSVSRGATETVGGPALPHGPPAAVAHPIPSTMTGILGPSGAGKSSLLDILAGRKRSGDGRVVAHVSLVTGGDSNGQGRTVTTGAKQIRRVAGYVPQEDVLPGTLTCYEHLMFHARLRMPKGATHAHRRARALKVLEELGLTRVADSRIGDELTRGLSGGERRRLSIAAELMARPALLFLDEPTTGLDAATALRVMTLLSGVVSRGTTVLCSLHQPRPRVLYLLDKVMLLSQGEVAYFGAPGDAASYFSSVGRPFPSDQPDPADAMLALCSREDAGALPSLFARSSVAEQATSLHGSQVPIPRSSSTASLLRMGSNASSLNGNPHDNGNPDRNSARLSDYSTTDRARVSQDVQSQKEPVEEESEGFSSCCSGRGRGDGNVPKKAGFLVQTEALSRRLLLRAMRHPLLLMLHFGGAVLMAVCLGTIFEGKLDFTFDGAQSRLGVLFFLLLYLSLLSLTSLPVWREDRRLFLTETMGGAYGHLPYFTSVALADVLLVRVIPPIVLAVVAYPLMGLNEFSDGSWTLLWFTLILVLANVTVALGAMGVGALGLPLDLSNFVGGVMVLIFALFGRFLLNGSRIPSTWRWLSDVTPLGYAYESLLINEFYDPLSERPYIIEGGDCSADLPLIKPLGSTILKAFNFATSRSAMRSNVASLAIIAAVFAVVSFLLFFLFTRTSPLKITKPSTKKVNRNTNSHVESTVVRDPENGYGSREASAIDQQQQQQASRRGHANGHAGSSVSASYEEAKTQGEPLPLAEAQVSQAETVEFSGYADGSRSGTTAVSGARGTTPRQQQTQMQPVLLSWDNVRFSLPTHGNKGKRMFMFMCGWGVSVVNVVRDLSRKCRNLKEDPDMTGRVPVLNDVAGFAGPLDCDQSLKKAEEAEVNTASARAVSVDGVSVQDNGVADETKAASDSTVSSSSQRKQQHAGQWRGSITAIMGPSGAGKTSLINILAGRRGGAASGANAKITGKFRINGEEVNSEGVRSVSGYVTQEDVLPETLTCFEHLMFHAELRMRGSSKRVRRHRVLEVLVDLGITNIKDSRIGGGLSRGISGGEKRRLSIGTELLTRPSLLFLDEPTTGLDSSTALTVMQLLSEVAARGTTILCSLHQPRPQVLDLLDRVILMSRGRISYFGAPSEASEYFESIGRPLNNCRGSENVPSTSAAAENGDRSQSVLPGTSPADAMLDLIGDAEIEEDLKKRGMAVGGAGAGLVVMDPRVLLEKVHGAERSAPPALDLSHSTRGMCHKKSRTASMLTQLKALGGRALLNVARDPYLATLHLLLTPVVGVVVGTLFEDLRRLNEETAGTQGRLGFMFFVLLFLAFLCLTSLAAWVKQMTLFRHERDTGAYGALAHLSTSFLADALVCRVLPPVILAVTVRPLAGLRYGSLGGLAGALIVFNLCLAAVLAACGTGARSAQEALAMGCLVVLFSALLSGYLVARDDLPAFWNGLVWVSPIAHGFEALVVNEFGSYGAIFRLSTEINGATALTPYLSGDDILSCFGFSEGRFDADLWLLGAVGAAGLVLAYLLIKRG